MEKKVELEDDEKNFLIEIGYLLNMSSESVVDDEFWANFVNYMN